MSEKPKNDNGNSRPAIIIAVVVWIVIIGVIGWSVFGDQLTSNNTDTTDTTTTDTTTTDTTTNDTTTDTTTTDTTTDTDEQPVDVDTSTLSGTPQEICDAATPAPNRPSASYSAAEQVLQDGVDYSAIFCTSEGAIYIDLFEEQAPVTVNNIVFLANDGFYNNMIFHRVIENFMAQGGDPLGTGTGGPGYRFEDEFTSDLRFDRPYLLAMANADPGTNGSQFFITFVPTPHLNDAHTIYGEVVSGQDVVDSILIRDPRITNAPASTLDTIVIIDDPARVSEQ